MTTGTPKSYQAQAVKVPPVTITITDAELVIYPLTTVFRTVGGLDHGKVVFQTDQDVSVMVLSGEIIPILREGELPDPSYAEADYVLIDYWSP